MFKYIIDKTDIDPNLLHEELGELGEQYQLLHNDTEVIIQFPKLTQNIDEETEGITYTKRFETTSIVDEEEITTVTNEPFDFSVLESTIQSVVSAHDKQVAIDRKANQVILQEIKESDSELLRGMEDVYEWAESMGFTPSQIQKDRIADRKAKRANLK